jgi:DNA-binding response OmpR family regulator
MTFPRSANLAARPEDGLDILIVEDDSDCATSMARLLRMNGHRVKIAGDGGAAMAEMQTASPDIVLLDIGLPDMSGYELAKELKGRKRPRKPFLIAVTGLAEADRRLSAKAGIDLHLVKPVPIGELEDALESARKRLVAALAKARLEASPYRSIRSLSCEFEDGVLVVRGQVRSYFQKQLAQTAVSAVAGMAAIGNQIEVLDSFESARTAGADLR